MDERFDQLEARLARLEELLLIEPNNFSKKVLYSQNKLVQTRLDKEFTEFKKTLNQIDITFANISKIIEAAVVYTEQHIREIAKTLDTTVVESKFKLTTCVALIYSLDESFKEHSEFIVNTINLLVGIKFPHSVAAQASIAAVQTTTPSVLEKIILKGSLREKKTSERKNVIGM